MSTGQMVSRASASAPRSTTSRSAGAYRTPSGPMRPIRWSRSRRLRYAASSARRRRRSTSGRPSLCVLDRRLRRGDDGREVGVLDDEAEPTRPQLDALPRRPLVGADRLGEDVDHAEIALDRGHRRRVDLRHRDVGAQRGRRRQDDPVLAERRHDVLDVAQEGRRRADEEDRAGQAGPLGVQQVRGPVERHGRLAGARRPLDDGHAGARATDHDVLLRLDRGHHVLHAAGPRRVERRQQRTLADEGQTGLARGADVEHLVLEPDQLAVAPTEVASPHDTHRVVRQRPVERLGGGRPPVDDERIAVLVRDGEATHVQAAAVDEVEAAHEQPVLRDVERGQPAAGVGDGAVALEQRLRVPRLGEPPRGPGQALGRAPHGLRRGRRRRRGRRAPGAARRHHARGDRRCGRHWKQASRRPYTAGTTTGAPPELTRRSGRRRRTGSAAGALAVLAPWPAAGSTLPSSSSSWVRRMRRARVVACLASSTQQMNSLRARGVMSFQGSSAVGLATSAFRRSAGSLCTTPPGTREALTAPR